MTTFSNNNKIYYGLSQPLNKLIDLADTYHMDAYAKTFEHICFCHNSVQADRFGDIFFGKTPAQIIDEGFAARESVQNCVNNDKSVLSNGLLQSFIEQTKLCSITTCLSIKAPLQDSANNLVGIFGLSFYFNEITLQKFVGAMHSFGLNLNFAQISNAMFVNNIHPKLSPREADCASLLLRGKTAKEIARILHLSYRTVEEYLIRLKVKFNCSNRSSLIEALLLSKE